jgi:hypothetical protein
MLDKACYVHLQFFHLVEDAIYSIFPCDDHMLNDVKGFYWNSEQQKLVNMFSFCTGSQDANKMSWLPLSLPRNTISLIL